MRIVRGLLTPVLCLSFCLLLAAAAARADPVLDEAVAVVRQSELARSAEAAIPTGSREALIAYLRTIDPYAQWLPPEEAEANARWTGAGLLGIGVSMIDDGSGIIFVPLASGQLARQGITEPVKLLALNGDAAEELGLEGVQRLLTNPAIDRFQAEIVALKDGRTTRVELRRGPYDVQTAELIHDYSLPVIRIHRFVRNVTRGQLRALVEPIAGSSQPFILDLRYSGGGDLFEALNSASLFLPQGQLLATLENARGESTAFTSIGGRIAHLPSVYLLVGPGTVSASEVFAAALQHHRGGRLVGLPTYGKCVSQTTSRMSDGSVLVLTTQRIRYADDGFCDGKGVTPDIAADPALLHDTDALIAHHIREELRDQPTDTDSGPSATSPSQLPQSVPPIIIPALPPPAQPAERLPAVSERGRRPH